MADKKLVVLETTEKEMEVTTGRLNVKVMMLMDMSMERLTFILSTETLVYICTLMEVPNTQNIIAEGAQSLVILR